MKNQGEHRHKLSLFWREQVGLSAAGSCPRHWGISPSFPCSFPPLAEALWADRQSCHPTRTGCRWHGTAWPEQGVHWGCGRSVQPPGAATTKSSAHSELFGWHSHILNFAVPEKGLDLLRVIKCSASFLKCLRHYRVETLKTTLDNILNYFCQCLHSSSDRY